jgi:hypothetical protein
VRITRFGLLDKVSRESFQAKQNLVSIYPNGALLENLALHFLQQLIP